MTQTKTLLELPFASERAVAWISDCLSRAGLSVMCSFDLKSVRLSPGQRCPCPYHGTKACNCQMVVLLVYADVEAPPMTLIIHGHDNISWLETPEAYHHEGDETLERRIIRALGMEPSTSVSKP